MQVLAETITLQPLNIELLPCNTPLLCARLDQLALNNKMVSGNKVCKLLPNIEQARLRGYSRIISFGGAWSNHLHALAAAGKSYRIATAAVVRGERPLQLNKMLVDAQENGMQLHFVSRKIFRYLQREQGQAQLHSLLGDGWVVPVGGSNTYGIAGVQDMARHLFARLPDNSSELWLASATGGTLMGVALALSALPKNHPLKAMRIKAVPVIKNPAFMTELRELLLSLKPQGACEHSFESVMRSVDVVADGELGRYASVPKFMQSFHRTLEQQCEEVVDQVYMLKVFYALSLRLREQPHSGTIVMLHTGGQQGRRGY
jgi:1-aminocyclopropane-1-carboxylate deaminase